MGKTTGISWTDATWDPWMGCHKVSEGCRNCYMFREQEHYGNDPNIVRRSKSTFNDPPKWKEPKNIFTCSWSDFFIQEAEAPLFKRVVDALEHANAHYPLRFITDLLAEIAELEKPARSASQS